MTSAFPYPPARLYVVTGRRDSIFARSGYVFRVCSHENRYSVRLTSLV